jgi:hypothetical protein
VLSEGQLTIPKTSLTPSNVESVAADKSCNLLSIAKAVRRRRRLARGCFGKTTYALCDNAKPPEWKAGRVTRRPRPQAVLDYKESSIIRPIFLAVFRTLKVDKLLNEWQVGSVSRRARLSCMIVVRRVPCLYIHCGSSARHCTLHCAMRPGASFATRFAETTAQPLGHGTVEQRS